MSKQKNDGVVVGQEDKQKVQRIYMEIISSLSKLAPWPVLSDLRRDHVKDANKAKDGFDIENLEKQSRYLRRLVFQWTTLGCFDQLLDSAWLAIADWKKGKSDRAKSGVDRTFAKDLQALEKAVWELWGLNSKQLSESAEKVEKLKSEVSDLTEKVRQYAFVAKCATCDSEIKEAFTLCRECTRKESEKRVTLKMQKVTDAKMKFLAAWLFWVDTYEVARGREISNLALEVAFREKGVELDNEMYRTSKKKARDIADAEVQSLALRWNSLAEEVANYVCVNWPTLAKASAPYALQEDLELTQEDIQAMREDPDLADVNFEFAMGTKKLTRSQSQRYSNAWNKGLTN